MRDEKWLDTVSILKDKFPVLEEGKEDLPEEEGRGFREFVIFNGPLGKMKIERTTKAIVLDKKTLGSKRMGSQASVEYVYSDTEKSYKFRAYKWDDGRNGWMEITLAEGL
jgi:hypothetical protein